MRPLILLVTLECIFFYPRILGSGSEAVAQKSNNYYNSSLDDSNAGAPLWLPARTESEPWFEQCQKRINQAWKNEPDGNEISKNLGYTFFLKADGTIEDPFGYTFGSSSISNTVALKVLQKASPFINPPVYLLYKRRILVSFFKTSDGQPNTMLRWDGYDYSNWKPEDHDKHFQEVKQMRLNKVF